MALNVANRITVGRILAVPVFIYTLLYYAPQRSYLRWVALSVFLLAVLSDVIDGYIARVYRQNTRAGAILDPLADKLLLISGFVCLSFVAHAWGPVVFPLWFVVAVVSRDIILLIGAMIIFLVRGDLDVKPSIWGKATAFLQVMCILGIFWQWPFSLYLCDVTLILVIISSLDYIRDGIKLINEPTN